MFVGTYTPKLDAKGRFFLPAKFRAKLEDGLLLTRGHEGCLVIWPVAEFEKEVKTVASGPSQSKKVRYFQRSVFAEASDDSWDDQGRILIPAKLREYARLKRELVVNGAYDRVEIWDAAVWDVLSPNWDSKFYDQDYEGTAPYGPDDALLHQAGVGAAAPSPQGLNDGPGLDAEGVPTQR
jgi:MraZ protein